MKHFLLLATLCTTFLFSNCKKDDPDPVVVKTPQELIIGKWNATKVINDSDDLIENTAEYKFAFEVLFSTGGTVKFTVTETDKTVTPAAVDTYTVDGTYSWTGNNLTFSVNDGTDDFSVTGTATVTEQKLVFTATSGDEDFFFSLLEADKI